MESVENVKRKTINATERRNEMACFLAPVAEAIATTVVQKVVEKRGKKTGDGKSETIGLTWGKRLGWLNKMLWGGSILLAFEHLWHGEIVPWPPFLTAMNNPADVAPMLHEIATIGTAMAVAITVVWGIMVLVVELKIKATGKEKTISTVGGAE
jgi:hypothetical protein